MECVLLRVRTADGNEGVTTANANGSVPSGNDNTAFEAAAETTTTTTTTTVADTSDRVGPGPGKADPWPLLANVEERAAGWADGVGAVETVTAEVHEGAAAAAGGDAAVAAAARWRPPKLAKSVSFVGGDGLNKVDESAEQNAEKNAADTETISQIDDTTETVTHDTKFSQ